METNEYEEPTLLTEQEQEPTQQTTSKERNAIRKQMRLEDEQHYEHMRNSDYTRKRKHSSDIEIEQNETETNNPNIWPRFIIVESADEEENTLNNLTPFAVSKYIQAMIGNVTSLKKLRSGSLLIEANNRKQAEKILKLQQFGTIPLKASPHNSLNKKKGVIRCADFKGMTDGALQKELEQQGVTEVKRITVFKSGHYWSLCISCSQVMMISKKHGAVVIFKFCMT